MSPLGDIYNFLKYFIKKIKIFTLSPYGDNVNTKYI